MVSQPYEFSFALYKICWYHIKFSSGAIQSEGELADVQDEKYAERCISKLLPSRVQQCHVSSFRYFLFGKKILMRNALEM
jgi:hypothetical protein